jgi:hypothetical protein
MGVDGLSRHVRDAATSEVASGPAALPPLVVDGAQLAFVFCRTAGVWGVLNGGFDALAEVAAGFLGRLQKMTPKLVVVFDGMDMPEMDEHKLLTRTGNRVAAVAQELVLFGGEAHPAWDGSHGTVLPHFAKQRVLELLDELGIEQERHLGEADGRVAELARELGGYAVTNDSDLIIFDTPGVVLLDSIQFLPGDGQGEEEEEETMLFELAARSKVATQLGVPEALLPALACIVGNDVVPPAVFQPLRNQISGEGLHGPAVVAHVAGFLRPFATVDEALQHAMELNGGSGALDKDTVLWAARQYADNQSRVPPDVDALPEAVRRDFVAGLCPVLLMNVMTGRTHRWALTAEDVGQPSAWSRLADLRQQVVTRAARAAKADRVDQAVCEQLSWKTTRLDVARVLLRRPARFEEGDSLGFVRDCLVEFFRAHPALAETSRWAVLRLAACAVPPSLTTGSCACRHPGLPSTTLENIELVADWLATVDLVQLDWTLASKQRALPLSLHILGDGLRLHHLLALAATTASPVICEAHGAVPPELAEALRLADANALANTDPDAAEHQTSSRPLTLPQRQACRFWLKGSCVHADCRFFHDPAQQQGQQGQQQQQQKPACRFFQNGFCRAGDSCRFRHT